MTSDTLFVYDGWNVMEELITQDSTLTTRYYVWGLDLSQTFQNAGGIGGLIASIDLGTSKVYYYQYDANGNVGQLVDESDGSIAAHYEYDPFGSMNYSTGPYADDNAFRFSTKFFDKETSLYYYGYRYYFPQLGRWLNRDPIEELGSSILRNKTEKKEGDYNLYAYVQNDPLNLIDPKGLAKYQIYWNMTGASGGAVGCVKVKGVVVSKDKKCDGPCKGMYEAANFEGTLCGASLGSPVGGTYNNEEEFEDRRGDLPSDVTNVEGWSLIIAGSMAAHRWGKSGGGYEFGDLRGTKKEVSDVDQGYDLSADIVIGKVHIVGDIYCVVHWNMKR